MDGLGELLGGAGALAAGGPLGLVAGLFGGWLQQRQKRKMAELEVQERQNDRDHELKMIDAETANMIKEAEIGLQVTQAEGDIASDLARYEVDGKVLELAQADVAKTEEIMFTPEELNNSAWARFFSGWVRLCLALIEGMRRSYRPVASYYSLAGLTYLVLWLTSELAKRNIELTDDQIVQMWWSVIDTCLFLSVTIITWWFVSRDKKHVFQGRG